MAIRKLNLEDLFDELDYTLIGIHTSIEDYRLVYLLNQSLNLQLQRKSKDLDFRNGSKFALFEWENTNHFSTWYVASNICKIDSFNAKDDQTDLFNDHKKITKTYYLIPEFKNVNYFLKINDDQKSETHQRLIVNKIQEIAQVSTAYQIDANQIKSKDNLIFN